MSNVILYGSVAAASFILFIIAAVRKDKFDFGYWGGCTISFLLVTLLTWLQS
jgi:hypothetical protein